MQNDASNPDLLSNKTHEVENLSRILHIAPTLPKGYDAWVYRGVKYASPTAIMNTSIDIYDDPLEWDKPEIFQTQGHDNTHYLEAVRFHHTICKCSECASDTSN